MRITTTWMRRLLLPAACVAFLAGCVEQPVEPVYERQASRVVDQAYILPGADFSQYTRLLAEPLEIYYPESDGEMPAEDIQRIRQIFRDAFVAAIADDYEIVSVPGPDVLRVRAQLIDMKVTAQKPGYSASGRLKSLVAHGELTFLMELSDSQTNTVLARAGDRTNDVSAGEDEAEWAAVEQAAQHWAGLFRNWLDDSLGKP